MKRMAIKILALLTALLLLCGGAAACSDSQEGNAASTEKLVVCGFESKRELLSIVYNLFGKAELDASEEYVTEGEYCAKLTTEIPVREEKGSDINMTFITGTQFISKTDYSDTVAFELDMYNASGYAIDFAFALNTYTILGYYTLETGANHLVIPVSRECYDLRSVDTIDFWFEGKTAQEEQPYQIYMDNLVAVTTGENVYQISRSYAGDTPFRFENDYEIKGVMDYMGTIESLFTQPRYSLNRDLQYVLTGSASMCVDFFTNSTGAVDSLGFRSIVGTSDLSWNDYEYDSTYLSFDMYNATDKDITVTLAIFTVTNETISKSFTLPANSWSDPAQARMLLQDILDVTVGDELDIMTIVFMFEGLTGDGDTIYLDNISFKAAEDF